MNIGEPLKLEGSKWTNKVIISGGGSKEEFSKSIRRTLKSKTMAAGFESVYITSDDEDFCPTCLEEYTSENPKIVTKCSHHFHLSCIYEWMQRSENCPVCGKVTLFHVLPSHFWVSHSLVIRIPDNITHKYNIRKHISFAKDGWSIIYGR